MHVNDASRAVGVVSSLSTRASATKFATGENREEQERLRRFYLSRLSRSAA